MFLNEEFIDNLDAKEDLTNSSSQSDNDIESEYIIQFGVDLELYQHDIVDVHVLNDHYRRDMALKEYDIWKKFQIVKRMAQSISFIKEYQLKTAIYLEQLNEVVREIPVEPSQDKRYIWDFLDVESAIKEFTRFTVGLSISIVYVP